MDGNARTIPQELSTRGRLIHAAQQLVDSDEVLTVEAVAEAAGVSRATAYRTFANARDLASEVAFQRSEGHRDAVTRITAGSDDALKKIEKILVYTATVVRKDEALNKLLPTPGITSEKPLRTFALSIVEPVLQEGQAAGHVRSDVGSEEITDWLLDAFMGGTFYRQLDAAAARRVFRTFLAPALAPPSAAVTRGLRDAELEQVLEHALAIVRPEGR